MPKKYPGAETFSYFNARVERYTREVLPSAHAWTAMVDKKNKNEDLVDEGDEDDGLVDEHEDLSRVLDYYEKKFKVKIGIMPAVYESDDIELDFIVDMDTEDVLGIRILQFLPVEEDEEEAEESEDTSDAKGKKGDAEKSDEVEEGEDDDQLCEVLILDLTRSSDPKVKITGKIFLDEDITLGEPILDVEAVEKGDDGDTAGDGSTPRQFAGAPTTTAEPGSAAGTRDEKEGRVHISIYVKENKDSIELTGATLSSADKPGKKITYLPNPDLL
ncbi:MAG: hypothetical protein GYA24_09730 [Candidatus Lokiarchaeota archaeon]|nr:hypothetical protein [Candidatus Lokiarchaeota archaeon]